MKYKVNDTVAWTMQDGNIMAGIITKVWYGNYTIRRVDGGICQAEEMDLRPATPEDIEAAIKFFQPAEPIDMDYVAKHCAVCGGYYEFGICNGCGAKGYPRPVNI